MKTTLLLFFSCSFAAFSQVYVHFPDSNAVWVNTLYEYNFESPIPIAELTNVNYFCVNGEDTLIEGNTYTKINKCEGAYHGAIRDNGGQVFYVAVDSTVEHLLYDFTVEVGDVLTDVVVYDMLVELTVSEVDSILINGTYRAKIGLEGSAYWIEGIGNTFGLFCEPWENVSGYRSALHCMFHDDTTYIHDGYESVNPGAVCQMDVGIEDDLELIHGIEIYPNPSNGIFNLKSELVINWSDVVISNLVGGKQEVAIESTGNLHIVDLSELETGVYLLTYYAENQLYQLRLVKE